MGMDDTVSLSPKWVLNCDHMQRDSLTTGLFGWLLRIRIRIRMVFYSPLRKSRGFLKEFDLAVAANIQHWRHKQNKQNKTTIRCKQLMRYGYGWGKIPATHDTEWILQQ